ncbi:MAG TPA: hypothetical protein VN894_12960, partial [Polyangiaceae bacterium]|nr:hypothetical protein [Polyangiaceae bacterium]
IVRLDGTPGSSVRVWANSEPNAAFDVGGDEDWQEHSFDIPASVTTSRTRIELRAEGGTLTTFHYWFFSKQPR